MITYVWVLLVATHLGLVVPTLEFKDEATCLKASKVLGDSTLSNWKYQISFPKTHCVRIEK